jgi:hypothetical protein
MRLQRSRSPAVDNARLRLREDGAVAIVTGHRIYRSADSPARLQRPLFGRISGRNAAGVDTSIAGDATMTSAGNWAVRHCHALKPSHRLVCTEP